ncbi:hypothetical protein [uncultured Tessaracoccus sp.]|uniref:hypothetical protein n=1 Tax=uncultured Tessaracoccus sp. TaxID=905023 RepID=UPI0026145F06|nr:hypothetical protein [uncultured Tessaracoccus sp.]
MRARDQSRYEAPVIEEERPRSPFPWKMVVGVFTVVVVLAVAAGTLYALVLRKPKIDERTIVKPSGSASTETILTPQDAVSQYLHALADGDIDKALKLGKRGGDEASTMALLSPKAHQAMRQKAPIEDIKILTTDRRASEVEVSYTLAGEPVQTTIPVVLDDRGSYELEHTTVTVVIELVQAESLPLLVNGVEVPKVQPIEVVPGVYDLSTGLPFIQYPSDNSFTIGSLQFADQTSLPATPTLTSQGSDAFRSAIQRALERCTEVQAPNPDGCPQGVRPAKPIKPGTLKWTLVGNPLAGTQPSLSTDDLSIGVVTLNMTFNLTFEYADGSNPGTQELKVTARASANMLGKSPEDVVVTWNK